MAGSSPPEDGIGGDDWVYVFDAATGKLIRRLGKLDNVIEHLTWSADGRYLAATLDGGEGLRVWETAGWSLVGDDRDYGGKDSYGAAFDATGRLYTVAVDGLLRRYGADFKLEGKSGTLGGKEPYSVAVHPNGDRIAVGFYDSTAVEVYRAEDLQRLFAADTADVANGNLVAVAWSADGARLYAGGRYRRSRRPSGSHLGPGRPRQGTRRGCGSEHHPGSSCPAAIKSQWAQQTRPSA